MAAPAAAGVPVWDLVVRLTHWCVAALVLYDYWQDSGDRWHRNLGYAAAASVVLRLVWGLVGSPPARFASWWPTPARLKAYCASLLAGRPRRSLGHNPLGASMMLALWSLILGLALTGWMSRLDYFWGEDRIKEIHAWLAHALIALAAIHVLAVLMMSRVQRENLVAAMLTGRKAPLPTDADADAP
jgi:cytochrome b